MRTTFIILAIVVWSMGSLLAGPQELVKERAKGVRDRNNERQGVPPSPPPAQPPASATAPPTARAAAKPTPTAKIKSDLLAWQSQKAVSAEAKKEFVGNLQTAVRGSKSPSTESLEKLTESLATALAGKSLGANQLSRLVQNINLALNSAGLSEERRDEVAAEVQSDLESAGATPASAATAATDLKAVMISLNQ